MIGLLGSLVDDAAETDYLRLELCFRLGRLYLILPQLGLKFDSLRELDSADQISR